MRLEDLNALPAITVITHNIVQPLILCQDIEEKKPLKCLMYTGIREASLFFYNTLEKASEYEVHSFSYEGAEAVSDRNALL